MYLTVFILIILVEYVSNVNISHHAIEKLVCPNRDYVYLPVANMCVTMSYHFRNNFDDRFKLCKNKTGSVYSGLPMLKNKNAFNEFCTWLNSLHLYKDCYYIWLGATDQEEEGVFRWKLDGEEMHYSNWLPGEPNDAKKELNEDCVRMRSTDCGYQDDNCEKTHFGPCSVYEVDRCQNDNGKCQHICVATGPRDRKCACREGFKLVNDRICVDVDECQTEKKKWCQNGSVCNNLRGGWECMCPKTHEKVGQFSCEGNNPCKFSNVSCHHMCRNEGGIAKCHCLEGYTLNSLNTCEIKRRSSSQYFLVTGASLFFSLIIPIVLYFFMFEKCSIHKDKAKLGLKNKLTRDAAVQCNMRWNNQEEWENYDDDYFYDDNYQFYENDDYYYSDTLEDGTIVDESEYGLSRFDNSHHGQNPRGSKQKRNDVRNSDSNSGKSGNSIFSMLTNNLFSRTNDKIHYSYETQL